jgi:hypothetical protein
MRMDSAGRAESEKAEHEMVRMDCAGRGESERQNMDGNNRTRNGSLPLTALSSRDSVIAKSQTVWGNQ